MWDEVYGRFPLDARFNVDEVPLLWGGATPKTVASVGDDDTQVRTTKGFGKRWCTFIPWLGVDRVLFVVVIFRGTGQRISEEEKAHYEGLLNVHVLYQPKAWSDRKTWMRVLKIFRQYRVADLKHLAEVLVSMDNLDAHKEVENLTYLRERCDGLAAFLSPNTTSWVQLCDDNIGKLFKVSDCFFFRCFFLSFTFTHTHTHAPHPSLSCVDSHAHNTYTACALWHTHTHAHRTVCTSFTTSGRVISTSQSTPRGKLKTR